MMTQQLLPEVGIWLHITLLLQNLRLRLLERRKSKEGFSTIVQLDYLILCYFFGDIGSNFEGAEVLVSH